MTMPGSIFADGKNALFSAETLAEISILTLPLLRPSGTTTIISRPGVTFWFAAMVSELTMPGFGHS